MAHTEGATVIVYDDDGVCPLYADTAGAAEIAQVTPELVRDWKRRGLLKPAHVVDGRPVYDAADVWAAERRTRVAATRRGGARRLASA